MNLKEWFFCSKKRHHHYYLFYVYIYYFKIRIDSRFLTFFIHRCNKSSENFNLSDSERITPDIISGKKTALNCNLVLKSETVKEKHLNMDTLFCHSSDQKLAGTSLIIDTLEDLMNISEPDNSTMTPKLVGGIDDECYFARSMPEFDIFQEDFLFRNYSKWSY